MLREEFEPQIILMKKSTSKLDQSWAELNWQSEQ